MPTGPLWKAATNGDIEQVTKLLGSGIKPDSERDLSDWTPLMMTAYKGYTECAIEILKSKANVNYKNKANWTPLTIAAFNGHTDCVIELVKAKADINSRNKYGWDTMGLAKQYNHHDIVRVIEQARADFDGFLKHGWKKQPSVKYCLLPMVKKSMTSSKRLSASSSTRDRQSQSWTATRDSVVLELYSTERSYLKHLNTLLKVYLEPLSKTDVIPASQIKAMKHGVEGIIRVNTELLKLLDAKFGEWDDLTTTVGDVISFICPWLKLYRDYVGQFSDFTLLCNKTAKAKKFLRKLHHKAPPALDEIDPLCGSKFVFTEPKEIEFYGIMPVQRIPKYQLFMEAMLKHTPPTHPDTPLLKKALADIKDIAGFLNTRLKEQLHLVSILRIQNMFSPPREDFLVPGRRFVREGMLLKVNGRGKAQRRYVFLFSDVLVYATRNLLSRLTSLRDADGGSPFSRRPRQLVYAARNLLSRKLLPTDSDGASPFPRQPNQQEAESREYKFHKMVQFIEVMPVPEQKVFTVNKTEWKFQFRVVAMEKSFILVAQSMQQLNDWVADIARCADEQRRIRGEHRDRGANLYYQSGSSFSSQSTRRDRIGIRTPVGSVSNSYD